MWQQTMMSSCEARVVPERRLTLNDALASSGFLEGFLRRKNMNQAIGIPDGAGSNPAHIHIYGVQLPNFWEECGPTAGWRPSWARTTR